MDCLLGNWENVLISFIIPDEVTFSNIYLINLYLSYRLIYASAGTFLYLVMPQYVLCYIRRF